MGGDVDIVGLTKDKVQSIMYNIPMPHNYPTQHTFLSTSNIIVDPYKGYMKETSIERYPHMVFPYIYIVFLFQTTYMYRNNYEYVRLKMKLNSFIFTNHKKENIIRSMSLLTFFDLYVMIDTYPQSAFYTICPFSFYTTSKYFLIFLSCTTTDDILLYQPINL